MLFISTTHRPATDLGYLLHKHPERTHTSELPFGKAHLVYPEAGEERTTAALLLDIDPVKIARGTPGREGLGQYVNDRPYAAGSCLSVAISDLLGPAMNGRSRERQELADAAIPLEAWIPVLRSRCGADHLRALFEPLGLHVDARVLPLDPLVPEWGPSLFHDVRLKGTMRLRDLLRALYVLIPSLDTRKHYYMDPGEVDKIVSKGEGWLADHPEKRWIISAYLGRKPSLLRMALEQLGAEEEPLAKEAEEDESEPPRPAGSEAAPAEGQADDEASPQADSHDRKAARKKAPRLHDLRRARLIEMIRELRPKSLLDLGCGDGAFIRQLLPIQGLSRIVGMDVAYFELEKARRRLGLGLPNDPGPLRGRVELLHGSLTYRDRRLEGFDACTIVEVVEHLDPSRLAAFERTVFHFARPRVILMTTPNRDYNRLYGLEGLRHRDHRFEWTREEFAAWTSRVAKEHGYQARIEGVGDEDPEAGSPSLLAEFTR